MSARIHRLPPDLVNKIAAGEVVERPASVVKELVENAIDAESSRVEVTLEEGGTKLIRVADDGMGMSPEDLVTAFEPHATSKLTNDEDLFRIHTMGFRGEALPSIASVSRCRAVSRERGASEGAEIECASGRIGEPRACGAPEGTMIEVRDLFFNVPARKKFLRAPATELRHATEALVRLALPYHALSVALTHNGRPNLRLDASESPRERLTAVFGADVAERLLPLHSDTAALTIHGMISPPGEGTVSSLQYVFLNGRYIRDRAIQRAVTEAYRSRLLRGRFPAVFLFLQMDPSRVDVNVHPTKIEVRFRDSGAVFAQLLTALEKTLHVAGPTPGEASAREAHKEGGRKAVAEFFARAPEKQQAHAPHEFAPPPQVTRQAQFPPVAASPSVTQRTETMPPASAKQESAHTPELIPMASVPVAPVPARRVFCQIHDSYLVEQTGDGFYLIDQHALHERILYEELRARIARASVPRQRLIMPEVVELTPDEFLAVMELKDSLLRMGVEVEPFGERTVAIHAVPHLAGEMNPRELLQEILAQMPQIQAGRPSDREEELLRVIACKAAVKAGDHLRPAQIEALLEQRDRLGPEPTCPHGCPTTLRFHLSDLEKQFKRK